MASNYRSLSYSRSIIPVNTYPFDGPTSRRMLAYYWLEARHQPFKAKMAGLSDAQPQVELWEARNIPLSTSIIRIRRLSPLSLASCKSSSTPDE